MKKYLSALLIATSFAFAGAAFADGDAAAKPADTKPAKKAHRTKKAAKATSSKTGDAKPAADAK